MLNMVNFAIAGFNLRSSVSSKSLHTSHIFFAGQGARVANKPSTVFSQEIEIALLALLTENLISKLLLYFSLRNRLNK